MKSKIFCVDNLKLMSKIKDEFIDLIYCDVLFGTGQKFNDYQDIKRDKIFEFYYKRIEELKRILKTTGLLYFHCNPENSNVFKNILDNTFGFKNFRNQIIWNYNSAPRKKKDFGRRHEVIFRYSKTNDYYFNNESEYIREPYSETAPRGYEKEKYYHPKGKILGDVWKIPILGQNDKIERTGYSGQKPINLMLPIIDSSCPPKGIVFDPFMGSGTTAVACKKLNRKFVGCDINKKAIEITKKRLQ